MTRARSTAGFSLIELMVVIAIVGVMTAAVMPSMTDMLADHRQAAATMDVVRMGRKARALTMASDLAHMVRFDQGADGLGTLTVLRGATSKCQTTPWVDAIDRPRELTPMSAYNVTGGATPTAADRGRHVIRLDVAYPVGTLRNIVQICYQPSGDTYVSAPPLLATLMRQPDGQPVEMTIRRSVDGVSFGTDRIVLFAAGGTARVR